MGEKIVVIIDKDLKDIVPGFLVNRKKDVEILSDAVSKKDFEGISVVAHKIAGNAGSYGFHQLGVIGANMEDAAKDNKIEAIAFGISEMEEYLENIEIKYE